MGQLAFFRPGIENGLAAAATVRGGRWSAVPRAALGVQGARHAGHPAATTVAPDAVLARVPTVVTDEATAVVGAGEPTGVSRAARREVGCQHVDSAQQVSAGIDGRQCGIVASHKQSENQPLHFSNLSFRARSAATQRRTNSDEDTSRCFASRRSHESMSFGKLTILRTMNRAYHPAYHLSRCAV